MKIIIVDKINFINNVLYSLLRGGRAGISGYYFEHNENLIQRNKKIIFIAVPLMRLECPLDQDTR